MAFSCWMGVLRRGSRRDNAGQSERSLTHTQSTEHRAQATLWLRLILINTDHLLLYCKGKTLMAVA